MISEKVRVYIRQRPYSDSNRNSRHDDDQESLRLSPAGSCSYRFKSDRQSSTLTSNVKNSRDMYSESDISEKSFQFNAAFSPSASQEEIFDVVSDHMLAIHAIWLLQP